ncbi:MAG: acetyl-CoA C-acetyltransferase [Myxococcaceae bacterium]
MDAFIVDAVRTPRGRGKLGKGGLSSLHPQELLAQMLQALVGRGLNAEQVDDFVAGCVSQANEQGGNISRSAVLLANWPEQVSAVTLNRFCGSGVQAVNFAAMGVMSGQQQLVVAGGVESMSRVPMGSDGAGIDGNNERLREKVFQVPQGISGDLIATKWGYTRQQLDEVALKSQKNASRAWEEKRFARSIVPVKDPKSGQVLLAHDEFVRPSTTLEGLLQLPPSFVELGKMEVPDGRTLDAIAVARYPEVKAIQHLHTAGNSSGIADGAAAVAIASGDAVKKLGLKPRAKIRAIATVGTEPVIMLTGPAPASRKALAIAGLKPSDIDLWEINEAFAAVVLQTIQELGIDPERVNVNGGAIALGHPLGATGAVLVGTAVDELERRGGKYAVVTMCIGGGQGIATVIERV